MKKLMLVLCLFLYGLPFSLNAGQTYVVAVGISDYKHRNNLTLPEKDAAKIAELFSLKTEHVVLITGKTATKRKIQATLSVVFKNAKKDDTVIFFFSGHGYPGGICPYDMTTDKRTGLSYPEIRQLFKEVKASKKILFFDACFSGGLRNSGSNSGDNAFRDFSNEDVLLFLSSRTNEASIERPFMVNGLYTTYLVRGLKGGADSNRDKKITARELFDFVSAEVIRRSQGRQHPVMWGKFDNNMVILDWNK